MTPDQAARQAEALYAAGELANSEAYCQAVLAKVPTHRASLNVMGLIREARRDHRGAIEFYDASIKALPGHAFAATRRAILMARPHLGNPPAARALAPGQPFVSMRQIGSNGRFGNSLLQYFVLRLYADRAGAAALAPDWIGRDLYGLDDPLPGTTAPVAVLSEGEATSPLDEPAAKPRAGVELHGFFARFVRTAEHARQFRAIFRLAPKPRAVAEQAMKTVSARGRTLVALHIRRGDFDGIKNWTAPTSIYRQWLESVWPGLDRPVLYIATDEPSVRADFADYSPLSAADLPPPIPGIEYFADHVVLSRADYVAVSPSSFSWTACLLNDRAKAFGRPDRKAGTMLEWDGFSPPWTEEQN